MSILGQAIESDPAKRDAWLTDACDGDEALKSDVERLLAHEKAASSFLEDSPLGAAIHAQENGELDGTHVGPYKIVREIGRGGMGTVYLAERADQEFAKLVAIKLIKRGMDTDFVLKRFRNERQILANLDHPNIARLLDGGTNADGLPYFVMEYVDGVSINEYCAELIETEILSLLRKVCSAVSFAHEKLIVHRDLKPSNILVNADGEPKLLDFGIAKLLDTTDARETQTHIRVLTPAYASPEQLAGDRVSAATDVYSLGKVLGELLNCSEDAPQGSTDKTTSKTALRSDLQNIIAMALRVDLARRYGSVESFSEDIRRYLEDLPVLARPDSFGYRTQKFVKRNRLSLVFAALLVLSLAAGMIATLWKANEARRESELAQQHFENLRKLSGSLITDIHGAIQNLPGSLPARQLLLRRATEQLDALAVESGDNRSLQADLARAYLAFASLPDLSINEKGAMLKKAGKVYEVLLQTEPENTRYGEQLALIYVEIGDTEKVSGSVAKAFEYNNAAVAILDQVSGAEPNDISKLKNLRSAVAYSAKYYELQGDATASLEAARREQQIVNQMLKLNLPASEASHLANRSRLHIGEALTPLGDYKAAISEIQAALVGFSIERAENPHDTSLNYYLWGANRRLATTLELDGNPNKALKYAHDSLSVIEVGMATSPKDIGYHRNSALAHLQLGQILFRQHQVAPAISHFRRALELSEEVLELDPWYFESKIDVACARANLGYALISTPGKAEGLVHLSESAKIYDETSRIDTDNALLKRDYAEALGWLASALERTDNLKSDEFHQTSDALWTELRSKGKLSAADISRTKEI